MGDYDDDNNDGDYSQRGGGRGGGARGGGRPSGGGHFGGEGTQQSPGQPRKNKEAQSVCPVTIKQLLEATAATTENNFKIDGKQLSQLTLVGQVMRVEMATTYINYEIDDSTGRIFVKLFIDNDNQAADNKETPTEGSYVRVFGNLRPTGATRSVVGFQLIPVHDFNEITYHYLEVIAVHLRNTQGAPSTASSSSSSSSSSTHDVRVKAEPGRMTAAPMAAMTTPGQEGWSELRKRVLAEFERDTSESGATAEDVAMRLGESTDVVKAEIMFFTEDGHLYSTVDDDHFKSTNSQ